MEQYNNNDIVNVDSLSSSQQARNKTFLNEITEVDEIRTMKGNESDLQNPATFFSNLNPRY